MKKECERQLYFFIKSISGFSYDRDDLGVIVGYGVMEGLCNFNSKSKSFEERKFEEIKTIYSEFERITTSSGNSRENEYSVLYELQSGIDKKIKDMDKNSQKKIGSQLLGNIIDCLKRKEGNYEDLLRRRGLDLIDLIQKNGKIEGTRKKTMNLDYESVKYCFTRKKGDRR